MPPQGHDPAQNSASFVEFPNRSGKTLRGILHRPSKAATHGLPAVVMFHGFTGNRMEAHWIFVKCSRALAQVGIASLRFDFYGSGESDGHFRQVTLRGEIADGRAAVEFLRRQKGIDPERVGLLGLSLGGAVAAALAASVEARVGVLWSALAHTARLRELIEAAAKPIPNQPGAVEFETHEISPRFLDDVLKVEPLRHLKRFQGPTLIIHPEKDEYLTVAHARAFFRASGAAAKELVIVSGADHVFKSVLWEREVIARTVQWFGRYL
jgi:dipeptidyl aminopeptidase/acylaminoacyl peptidase